MYLYIHIYIHLLFHLSICDTVQSTLQIPLFYQHPGKHLKFKSFFKKTLRTAKLESGSPFWHHANKIKHHPQEFWSAHDQRKAPRKSKQILKHVSLHFTVTCKTCGSPSFTKPAQAQDSNSTIRFLELNPKNLGIVWNLGGLCRFCML